jgi:hypothetical protein
VKPEEQDFWSRCSPAWSRSSAAWSRSSSALSRRTPASSRERHRGNAEHPRRVDRVNSGGGLGSSCRALAYERGRCVWGPIEKLRPPQPTSRPLEGTFSYVL